MFPIQPLSFISLLNVSFNSCIKLEHLNDDFDNEDELYAKHKKKMPKSDLSSKAIRHNDINFKINDVDEKYYGQEISR